jgi:hypothetical protein
MRKTATSPRKARLTGAVVLPPRCVAGAALNGRAQRSPNDAALVGSLLPRPPSGAAAAIAVSVVAATHSARGRRPRFTGRLSDETCGRGPGQPRPAPGGRAPAFGALGAAGASHRHARRSWLRLAAAQAQDSLIVLDPTARTRAAAFVSSGCVWLVALKRLRSPVCKGTPALPARAQERAVRFVAHRRLLHTLCAGAFAVGARSAPRARARDLPAQRLAQARCKSGRRSPFSPHRIAWRRSRRAGPTCARRRLSRQCPRR